MNVPVLNGQLPQGFCPPDYQTMLNAFSAQQFVQIDAVSTGSVASNTPPADHSVTWLQLDSLGRPVRTYFYYGAWLSRHPLPPGFTMLWNQALPNFQTFDGGDAVAAPWSDVSGQMWQLMAATLDGLSVAPANDVMNTRVPIGVGTFRNPDGTLSTRTVVLGQQGGEDQHILTQPEIAPHYHTTKVAVNKAVKDGGSTDTSGKGGFVGPIVDGGTEILTSVAEGDPATAPPGGVPTQALAHNTLPPYNGVYFLQRTNRLFYVVP